MRSSFFALFLISVVCALVSCSGTRTKSSASSPVDPPPGSPSPGSPSPGGPSSAAGAVVTRNYDNARSGVNLQETQLTPDTVNPAHFGKLFSYPVDGSIYGQPLYVPGLTIAGGKHNVIYVATQNDSAYAFDADKDTGGPLWKTSLVDAAAGETSVPCAVVVGCSTSSTIGVTSTPVISLERNVIYVEARSTQGGAYFHKLHALDLATGAEKLGGPAVIQAAVPGTGNDADAQGIVHFNNLRENNRSALLLVNGVVYICFASLSDVGPYHGWVLAYNADTLQQVAAFNTTPNGTQGGSFANNGPAADNGGNIYAVTGNGSPPPSQGNFGQTFIKLSGGSLNLVDFFAPFNAAVMNLTNIDVGSGGFLLLPDQTGTAHPHLLVGAGKEGRIYLIDRDNMGKFNRAGDQVVQSIPNAIGPGDDSNWYSPVLWNGTVYFSGTQDVIKAFSFNNGLLSTTPIMQAATTFTFPGAGLILSANGNSGGILWALEWHEVSHLGTLHAYDAKNLSRELWNSDQSGARDSAGATTRLNVPLVINGKVYVSGKTNLLVYGLLP